MIIYMLRVSQPPSACRHGLRVSVAGRGLSGVNPSTGTLRLHSNGPLYSSTVIGTLAVDRWAVTFGTARRGLGGLWQTYHVESKAVHCPTNARRTVEYHKDQSSDL